MKKLVNIRNKDDIMFNIDLFIKLTKDMDIPENRRIPKPENFRWFVRNAFIRNKYHKNFNESIKLVKNILNT